MDLNDQIKLNIYNNNNFQWSENFLHDLLNEDLIFLSVKIYSDC